MMGLGRERRLNCRLYVDRQTDAVVIERLDRMLAEKHFLNQTELIKHGIELVYSEVYADKDELGKVTASGADVQVLAELLVELLKPELQQMVGDFEEKIVDSMKSVNASVVGVGAVADENLVEAVVSAENEPASIKEPEKESIGEVHDEKTLSGSAISFLKGLNED